MLTEHPHVVQDTKEFRTRWFSDDYFDLTLWQRDDGSIVRFELSYNRRVNEHALTWDEQGGFSHLKVDDGEREAGQFKMSPMFMADGVFNWKDIAERFERESRGIEAKIASFVHQKILDSPVQLLEEPYG